MTGPHWLAVVLTAVMLLIAAGSATRLALWRLRGRDAEPEADVVHLLMGVAMAGMLEPVLSPVPATAWRIVFGAATAWFGWRAVRVRWHSRGASRPAGDRRRDWECAHPAPHFVECAAMVYMLVPAGTGGNALTAMPGMASAAAAANPAVVIVLALFMLGYILWTADRMASEFRARSAAAGLRPAAPGGGVKAAPAPGTTLVTQAALITQAAACSKIAMSLTMGYMLLTML